jgi:hypothetical protein
MTNTPIESKTRIMMVATSDPYTHLAYGAMGTVIRDREVMGKRTIDVDWDNGSRLSLLPDEGDRFEVTA